MAILLISFDKTGSQKRFEGKTGFIVPTHSTKLHAYAAQSYNLKGRAEVKINNKSNYIHKVLLTVLAGACQESNHTSS